MRIRVRPDGLPSGRRRARGVLGGQADVNDAPSGNDLVQFRGDRSPGDSARYGRARGCLCWGVLPVPADATPWPTNTNAQLSRTTYVELNYPKTGWATEEAEMASRRFVAAVQEGWRNPDGSQQAITIVRFEGEDGATSAWDELTSGYETQYPHSLLTDSTIGAVGWSTPKLNSTRYAISEWAVGVGD